MRDKETLGALATSIPDDDNAELENITYIVKLLIDLGITFDFSAENFCQCVRMCDDRVSKSCFSFGNKMKQDYSPIARLELQISSILYSLFSEANKLFLTLNHHWPYEGC